MLFQLSLALHQPSSFCRMMSQINSCRRMSVLLKGRNPESVGACTLQICSLNVNSHGHSQASKLADLGTVLVAEVGALDSLTCKSTDGATNTS